jgi:3-mercaptopyruvate sulfurtransferase SseA
MLKIPEDVEIVLYSSIRKPLLSAQVALALQRKGVTRATLLEGGFEASRALGLPVRTELSTPQQVAQRLCIELPSGDESPASSLKATTF